MGSISTRTGDDGTTGLVYGQRVAKDHPRVEAVGCADEWNVALGVAKAACANARPDWAAALEAIQRDLVALMGELAADDADQARYLESKFAQITPEALARLDAGVAELEGRGLRFDGWATPGANAVAAAFDAARVAARRTERRMVGLGEFVRPIALQYVNRASDYLWLLARAAEQ